MRDVHGGHARCGSVTGASRFLTGLVTCFATHDGIPAVARAASAPVGAGRHADQLGEAGAEGAQRRAADREADLGDAEVAAAQQRHRALDAPRHQVAVRRLAVGELELAAEVPGRHVRAAGERLDVQRLRVLPVDPVADPAQPREVAQVLRLRRVCWSPTRSCHVAPELPSAAGVPPHSASALARPEQERDPLGGPGWYRVTWQLAGYRGQRARLLGRCPADGSISGSDGTRRWRLLCEWR